MPWALFSKQCICFRKTSGSNTGRQTCFLSRRRLTSLRPCTSQLSSQNGDFLFTKVLAYQWQTINHKIFKTKCCWYRGHLTMENNLKVKKGHSILKTSTTIDPPNKTFGVRVEANIPKNSYASNAVTQFEKYCTVGWKKLIRDSRLLVHKKAFDFVLSWTFVQRLLLAGMGVLLKKTNIKEDWFANKNYHTGSSCFTLALRCYTREKMSFIHLCCSRRYT